MGLATREGYSRLYFRNAGNIYRPKQYKINVDGSNLMFKGLSDNETDIERIAQKSFIFLQTLIGDIMDILESQCKPSIDIYFDQGNRNPSKADRRPTEIMDEMIQVKHLLIMKCNNAGYNTPAINGEAELYMYLKRDIKQNLNIFVTGDTDIYPITYNHTVELPENTTEFDDICQSTERSKVLALAYKNGDIIFDSAVVYLWGKENILFSVDNCAKHISMSPNCFHILCGLGGTDYTQPVLTKTMVMIILSNINQFEEPKLNTWLDYILTLLIYAIKNGASLKPKPSAYVVDENINIKDCLKIYDAYIKYIKTGEQYSIETKFSAYDIFLYLVCGIFYEELITETKLAKKKLINAPSEPNFNKIKERFLHGSKSIINLMKQLS